MQEAATRRAASTERLRRRVADMIAYQRGELEGFESVFDEFATPVHEYLASVTGSAERADELLERTFLRVHRLRHTYRPPRAVKPWIFGIAGDVLLLNGWARCIPKHPAAGGKETIRLTRDTPVIGEFPR